MTRLIVHFSDATDVELVSSSSPVQLYQVMHDYEIYRKPDGSVDETMLRNGLPEVFRLNPHHVVKMTKPIQLFMFDLLSREMDKVGASLEQKKAAWRYLYARNRAFTNAGGVDDCIDYITPANLSLTTLPRLATLVCGGNVLTGTEVMAKWGTTIEPCLQVNTIDPSQPLPVGSNRESSPSLIQYATNSTRSRLSDGTYLVTRFSTPKMMGANAPVPILARVVVVYPMRFLKKLPPGSPVPTPYNYP